MKITVFGASGGTGLQVVRQACEAGHTVTAVVRDPARLAYRHQRLEVTPADVMDPSAVGPVVAGREAVVTAIGPRAVNAPTTVQADSAASIVQAMTEQGVRRLIAVSNSGMFTEGDGLLTRAVAKPILRRVLRHVFDDALRMEQAVRASGLDWTIARPPRLTDKPGVGRYRTAVNRNVRRGFTVSRADVADLVLRCLQDPDSVGTAVALAR